MLYYTVQYYYVYIMLYCTIHTAQYNYVDPYQYPAQFTNICLACQLSFFRCQNIVGLNSSGRTLMTYAIEKQSDKCVQVNTTKCYTLFECFIDCSLFRCY